MHLPVRPDWLARRREEILEPDLPIVDPHHHLVERPETGRYLLPELLADTGAGTTSSRRSISNGCRCTAPHGPAEMRPVGEVEFANGVAAMAASGVYGKTQVCAGIVGYADLALGARGRDGAGGRDRGRRRPGFRGHPLHLRDRIPTRRPGARRCCGRRVCCCSRRCAKASPSSRRSGSSSTPGCSTRSSAI